MADTVRLVEPQELHRNPENPRLIFRQEELQELEDSIAKQGILVPLTVFQDKSKFYILDGERRWRSSLKLGLNRIPVIIQPKPDRMENIMMMFAIHNARRDWDPLPTALKLEQLEFEYSKRFGKKPTEHELAGIASLSRGEVRRLRMLLQLPSVYRDELISELEKPRSKQDITVDHVIEATKAVSALRKQYVVDHREEEDLRRAIIDKFRSGVISNTIAPRKLVKMAQAIARGEVPISTAKRAVANILNRPEYSIEDAFSETVEQVDFEHTIEQLIERLHKKIKEHNQRNYQTSDALKKSFTQLQKSISAFLRA